MKALQAIFLLTFLLLVAPGPDYFAHNMGNGILWNREISRIFYQRCASCHREGGTAFSLMEFREVQPHAERIKAQVLSRRMPPWGAVKGFGEFQNEQGLSVEEIQLISDWVDSNTPRGNNPNVLPKVPKFKKPAKFKPHRNAVEVSGPFTLKSPLKLDGLFAAKVPPDSSMKIVAVFPDGHIEPLLWLYEYQEGSSHPFLLKKPLSLPAGTIIQGVRPDARVLLIPGKGK